MAESRRKIRRRGTAPGQRSRWRMVAASAVGLFLIASAYQFAFATGNVGFSPDYGPTTDTGDNTGTGPGGVGTGTGRSGGTSSSSNSLANVLVPVGGGSGVGAFAIGALTECSGSVRPLPEGQREIGELEIVSDHDTLDSGTAACFHVHGRSLVDGKWYDITEREGTTIELKAGDSGLVRQQGSSHRYCLPLTASGDVDGRTVTVTAKYQPQGTTALVAETKVTLHVVR
jgi:hypothetical protein